MKRRRADLAHLHSRTQAYKTLWNRIKRGGVTREEYLARVRKQPKPLCLVEGCGRPWRARKYCPLHYWRFMRHGDPLSTQKPRTAKSEGIRKLSTKEYFADMPKARIIVSREILRSLGR